MGKRRRSSSCSKRVRRRLFKVKRGPKVASPFPMSRTVWMRYCTTISLDADTGGSASYLFRANSIFDPDLTGTGHQPYGHDQWQSVYNHYLVSNSRIRVTAIPQTTGTLTAGIVGIAIKDDATVETDFDTIRETTGSKWTFAVAQRNNRVRNSFALKKMFPKEASSYQSLSAQFGASPTESAVFQVYSTGYLPDTQPGAIACIVTIDYKVKMFELKDLGQS